VPITVAVRSKAWTVFARLDAGITSSNPTWDMDICVRLFCVCAVLCVQIAALRRADPPAEGSYQLCKRSSNWKEAKVQQRALEPQTGRQTDGQMDGRTEEHTDRQTEPMERWLMSVEFERIWKKLVSMAHSKFCPEIRLKGLGKSGYPVIRLRFEPNSSWIRV
jgi:hypothetical protein